MVMNRPFSDTAFKGENTGICVINSRLVTEWEIYQILDKYIPYDGKKDKRNKASGELCRLIEERFAKTASIVRAEVLKKICSISPPNPFRDKRYSQGFNRGVDRTLGMIKEVLKEE